jgi:hypothetical protein
MSVKQLLVLLIVPILILMGATYASYSTLGWKKNIGTLSDDLQEMSNLEASLEAGWTAETQNVWSRYISVARRAVINSASMQQQLIDFMFSHFLFNTAMGFLWVFLVFVVHRSIRGK